VALRGHAEGLTPSPRGGADAADSRPYPGGWGNACGLARPARRGPLPASVTGTAQLHSGFAIRG
jgi:hypothetical protein